MGYFSLVLSALLGVITIHSQGTPPSSPPQKPVAETKPSGIGSWAEVIEAEVDPAVVTDPALRDAIKATARMSASVTASRSADRRAAVRRA